MGSSSRMSRCERFRKKLEKKIVEAALFQVGDFLEVKYVMVGMTDDGTDVSKLYVTLRNTRTGEEDVMASDDCIFSAEDADESNVDRLQAYLHPNHVNEKKQALNRKMTIKLLKDAQLISPKYREKP